MDIRTRERFRRPLDHAIDVIAGLRTTTAPQARLAPIRPVSQATQRRPIRRSVRPVRSWERMVRI